MLAFAYYILKVVVCSAILFGYYWFFLRNKIFHAYNRFYLLAVVVLSLSLPLIRFQLFPSQEQPKMNVIKMLQVVSAGDDYVNDVFIPAAKPAAQQISFTQALPFIYMLVSLVFLIMLVQMVAKILIMLKRYHASEKEGIVFINTNEEKGTPFSFFRYIFWNSAINIETPSGSRIFRHEVAHIREKHSLDKMFINIVLAVFWCNPVFWLIRRELNMIHEFIADKRAVEDGDTAAFAAMILEAAYPHHRMQITNNFFYSPIKRRLMMLTKDQHKRMNYISRLLVLPLAFVVFAAFTIKARSAEKKKAENQAATSAHLNNSINPGNTEVGGTINKSNIETTLYSSENPITVVIDASHGGNDNGGVNSESGYWEKDLTLLLAKKIAALNTNKNIKVILTRNDDSFSNPKEKAAFTKLQNPDLFISIHINSGPLPIAADYSGMEVYIPSAGLPQVAASQLLASAVIGSFKENYGIDVIPNPLQRKQGIWVINANNIPSVLIEAGYINNPKDIGYLTSAKGQEIFAKNVLNAISAFAAADKTNLPVSVFSDSLGIYKGQKVTGIRMTNKSDKVELILANGKNVWVTKEECEKLHIKLPPPAPPVPPSAPGAVAPPPPPPAPLQSTYKGKEISKLGDYTNGGIVITYADKSTEVISNAEATKAGLYPFQGLIPPEPKNIPTEVYKNQIRYALSNDNVDASQTVFTGETKDIFQMNTRKMTVVQAPAILPLGEKKILTVRNGIMIDSKNIKLDKGDEVVVLKPSDAVAKYGANAADGAIEISTPVKPFGDPVFRVGNFNNPRIPAAAFVNQKYLTLTDGFSLVSAIAYFSGEGFPKVEKVIFTSDDFTAAKEQLAKCVKGSAVTFVNIKVKNIDGTRVIDEKSYLLY